MIRKFCAERGCKALVVIGTERCPEHAKALAQRRNEDRKARGLFSPAWRALRKRVLKRDRDRCQLRFEGCTLIATEVHLDPRLEGDHTRATDADCVAACQSCNVYERNHRSESGRKADGNRNAEKELIFG